MDESDRREPEPSCALCLSGGGFRATFFHLGVVRALFEAGWLPHVADIFSVSGGSILAAHLALHWKDFEQGEMFLARSLELVRFAQMDMRGRILRRAPIWWLPEHGRIALLEACYRRLFGNATLAVLASVRPRFHFLATCMDTGRLFAFNEEGLSQMLEPEDQRWNELGGRLERVKDPCDPATFVDEKFPMTHSLGGKNEPLSRAVAASSAFPPLFPPLRLARESGGRMIRLTDGGVFDNAGISRIHGFVPLRVKDAYQYIFVSDASAVFNDASKRSWWSEAFWSIVPRTVRTTDILMQRVASLESELWRRHKTLVTMRIQDEVKPGDVLDYKPLCQNIQRRLPSVRTDLDVFGPDLVRALVQHGHEVAMKALRPPPGVRFKKAVASEPWDPCPQPGHSHDEQRIVRIVEDGASRRVVRSLLSAYRDSALWGSALVLIVFALALSGYVGWNALIAAIAVYVMSAWPLAAGGSSDHRTGS
jgi:predicted acylesterase/phospholipase RssA